MREENCVQNNACECAGTCANNGMCCSVCKRNTKLVDHYHKVKTYKDDFFEIVGIPVKPGFAKDVIGLISGAAQLDAKMFGDLAPAHVLVEAKMKDGAKGGFIFDGFPRTLKQADALADLMTRTGATLDRVIEMQVDDAALVARVTGRFTCGNCGAVYHDVTRPTKIAGTCDVCGSTNLKRRADDNEETLKTRLMEYYKKTSPLIGYYYALGDLFTIDGLAPIEVVSRELTDILDQQSAT